MLLIALAGLALVWTVVAAVVVGLCVSAANGDRVLLGSQGASAGYTLPRRSTWRAVRSSSLRSCQSDQLAT
jgi:hypothetical protein